MLFWPVEPAGNPTRPGTRSDGTGTGDVTRVAEHYRLRIEPAAGHTAELSVYPAAFGDFLLTRQLRYATAAGGIGQADFRRERDAVAVWQAQSGFDELLPEFTWRLAYGYQLNAGLPAPQTSWVLWYGPWVEPLPAVLPPITFPVYWSPRFSGPRNLFAGLEPTTFDQLALGPAADAPTAPHLLEFPQRVELAPWWP